jgi:hypothetical protein
MKLLPLLLIASLVANASLLVVHLRMDEGGAASGAGVSGGSGSPDGRGFFTEGAGKGAKASATGANGAIARALQSGDAEALRDELRAAGVDEDIVRAVVGMRLWKRHETRMRALQAGPGAKQEWWKNDNDWWGGQTKEQRAEMKALQAEIKAESERLLGKDPNALANNPWLARQYGFLPADKREALQQLEQDYNELGNELRQEAQGFTLPSDREKTKFLMAEKRADLEALLTPEELKDYDLRQSRTAQNMRWQMTQMDASEAEYRTIFEIRKGFDEAYNEHDQFGNRTRTMTQDDWKARAEAEKAMKAEIKAALGAERYADYVRSQDNDYQQLRKATERFALPADTPAKVYALRDEVPAAAARVADDVSLTPEQKKAEVAKLAAEARDRVKGMLGPEVAQAYFDQNGMQWLQQLEKGTIIIFDEEGGQKHRRIDQPARK